MTVHLASISTVDRTPKSPGSCAVTPRPLPSPCATLSRQPKDEPLAGVNEDSSGYTELCPEHHTYVERLQEDEPPGGEAPLKLDGGRVYVAPLVETVSCFRPASYQSALMPRENKPLEVGILRRVKELVAELEPRTAAQHITKADCVVRQRSYFVGNSPDD